MITHEFKFGVLFTLVILFGIMSCESPNEKINIEVFETSSEGNKHQLISTFPEAESEVSITINPKVTYQTITGFGGAFTESSAHLLNKLSTENRNKIIEAYFGDSGAKYSLARTHMNSCDFSLSNYSYSPVAGDKNLDHFSIQEDLDDLIPMIKDAMKVSTDGFKLIASPWTAAPWMKDNKKWVGGKLLPEYYDTWALFFSKYVDAYENKGIPIWGFTVENEPHGNGENWESMHFTPEEMTDFVKNHLGPTLEAHGKGDKIILGYDQNRADLKDWVDVMYANEENSKYYDGTAIHWYESTYDYFPKELQYAHNKAPNKYLIQTEACVDADVPKWKDDDWYWSKEATDWGWDWAPEEQKHWHPKYVPVFRYARDIIGCLNNWVDGWIDWNMVLDKQGGPNWFKNWCVAPVIVDPISDEIYFTPIYYTLMHFSKHIRPGAQVIAASCDDKELMISAVVNPDKSKAVLVFNPTKKSKTFELVDGTFKKSIQISAQAIQTITIK